MKTLAPAIICRFIALLLMWSAGTTAAAEKASDQALPTLETALLDFPPFKWVDENGHATGPWVRMSEKVAAEAGYQLHWVQLPIARILLYLESGRIDFWPGAAGIPQLKGKVVESESTPMHLRLMAYHRGDMPAITQTADLEGHHVIKVVGFHYLGNLDGITFKPNEIAVAPNHRAALTMLEMGRGDYVLDYDEVVEALKPDFPNLQLQGEAIDELRGAFLVSRKNPEAERIIKRLDAAYQKLMMNGEIDHLPETPAQAKAAAARKGVKSPVSSGSRTPESSP